MARLRSNTRGSRVRSRHRGVQRRHKPRRRSLHVHYHPRLVGLRDSHPFVRRRRADAERWPDTNIWSRVTAGQLAVADAGRTQDTPRLADSSTLIGVDEFAREERLESVDFLKIDVDGPDLEVLESARQTLVDRRVLGVGMEVNWFGSANPTEHTFHNTDRMLREHGFALFGLTIRRYSRSDAAGAVRVRLLRADAVRPAVPGGRDVPPRPRGALHLEDLAHSTRAKSSSSSRASTSCSGLPDCAAEMLNVFATRLETFGDRIPLLDALTPPLLSERLTYREYLQAFARHPRSFLPGWKHSGRHHSSDGGVPRNRASSSGSCNGRLAGGRRPRRPSLPVPGEDPRARARACARRGLERPVQ